MNEKYMKDNGIDTENTMTVNTNDCLVTVYFVKNRNTDKENMILESLLDTFEKRMNVQINSSSF